MNVLDQIKDTVEVDEETKKVIFHYPNMSAEYDLSRHKSEYYKLMSLIHRTQSSGTGYIITSAKCLVEQAGLNGMVSINITERDRLEDLKKLNHHKGTTVGLWATDKPELFKDHPKYDLLFKIEF